MKFKHMTSLFALSLLVAPYSAIAIDDEVDTKVRGTQLFDARIQELQGGRLGAVQRWITASAEEMKRDQAVGVHISKVQIARDAYDSADSMIKELQLMTAEEAADIPLKEADRTLKLQTIDQQLAEAIAEVRARPTTAEPEDDLASLLQTTFPDFTSDLTVSVMVDMGAAHARQHAAIEADAKEIEIERLKLLAHEKKHEIKKLGPILEAALRRYEEKRAEAEAVLATSPEESFFVADEAEGDDAGAGTSAAPAEADAVSADDAAPTTEAEAAPEPVTFKDYVANEGNRYALYWNRRQYAADYLHYLMTESTEAYADEGLEAQARSFITDHGLEALAQHDNPDVVAWVVENGIGKVLDTNASAQVTLQNINDLVIARYAHHAANGVKTAKEIEAPTVVHMLKLADAVHKAETSPADAPDETAATLAGATTPEQAATWKLVNYYK